METGKARMTVATQHRELPAEIISAAFARALAAAEAYRGATSPNPPVGCVVLDGQGWELAVAAHQRAKRPGWKVWRDGMMPCLGAGARAIEHKSIGAGERTFGSIGHMRHGWH